MFPTAFQHYFYRYSSLCDKAWPKQKQKTHIFPPFPTFFLLLCSLGSWMSPWAAAKPLGINMGLLNYPRLGDVPGREEHPRRSQKIPEMRIQKRKNTRDELEALGRHTGNVVVLDSWLDLTTLDVFSNLEDSLKFIIKSFCFFLIQVLQHWPPPKFLGFFTPLRCSAVEKTQRIAATNLVLTLEIRRYSMRYF